MFISADLDWMDYGQQNNLINAQTRANLLGNRLVLVAPKDATSTLNITRGFDLASALKGGRLSMAHVDAVPAGEYGKTALEKLGYLVGLKEKICQTDNLSADQVLF